MITIGNIEAYPAQIQWQGTYYAIVANRVSFAWSSDQVLIGLNTSFYNSSGAFLQGLNEGGVNFPTAHGAIMLNAPEQAIGQELTVQVKGLLSVSSDNLYSYTQVTSFKYKSPQNSPSLTGFLRVSGLTGSGGIAKFIPPNLGGSLKITMGL
jgi:hypothetical protein